jgi:SAM-dependent methyltransferase
LRGYPRNHNYRMSNGRLVPSFRLYERLRTVTSLYPQPLESFLDVGCCRGGYVIEAAQRPDCRVAVGIDVHAPFIAIAEEVRDHLGVEAAFHLATLDDVASCPEVFGGPFQTVLLLGTYHYLFWGGPLCPRAYRSHEEILAKLARVCSGRLVFSARLELGRLPRAVREKAQAGGPSDGYTTSRFREVARQFFDVREAGHLGRDALLVMSNSSR